MTADHGRCFIDTNIWLYALIEGQNPQKNGKAKILIAETPEIVLSTQVINEICVNLIRKAEFAELEIRMLIADFHETHLVVEIDRMVQTKASEIRDKHRFSFWDSFVAASALLSGAQVLYSEDMQDGFVLDGKLSIVNPLR